MWNRQGLRLTQTGTGLVSPLSLLPDLRTNKDEGQQNFVNPGIFIVQGGVDAELTPKLRAFTTVSALSFHHTAPLEALLFQSPIRKNIGVDLGGDLFIPLEILQTLSKTVRERVPHRHQLNIGVGL